MQTSMRRTAVGDWCTDLYSGLARSVQGHEAGQHASLPPQLPGGGLQAGQGGGGTGKGDPGGGRGNAEFNMYQIPTQISK